MANNSTVFQGFYGKIKTLHQHIQLVDVSLKLANKKCNRKQYAGQRICNVLNGASHEQLDCPNTGKELGRLFSLSRYKLNEQAIIDAYRLFSMYLSQVYQELAKINPMNVQSLLKSDRSLSYTDVIELGSYENIINDMAKKVFRALENKRSTVELLKGIENITNIHIDENLKKEALFYLNIRHLIIHNDCKQDLEFKGNNLDWKVKVHSKTNRISMTYELSEKTIRKAIELCYNIDNELVEKELLKQSIWSMPQE